MKYLMILLSYLSASDEMIGKIAIGVVGFILIFAVSRIFRKKDKVFPNELTVPQENTKIYQTVNNTNFGKPTYSNIPVNELFDSTFEENKNMVIYGSLLMFISSLFYFVILTEKDYETLKGYANISIALIIIRLLLIIWVSKMARSMNRNPIGWGSFTFLFPAISLIILGTRKKKIYPSNFSKLSKKAQSAYLNDYACKLEKKNFLVLALALADKSVAIEASNHFAYDTRGAIYLRNKEFDLALHDFNTSITLDGSYGEKFYNRGFAKYYCQDFIGAKQDWESAIGLGFEKARESLRQFITQNDLNM